MTRRTEAVARASARGLVAAMAMTGLRVVTTGTGLLERTPPDTIVDQAAPAAVAELPPEQRTVVTELAHWAYGAVGGAAYGALASHWRIRPWAGPAYGIGLWLAFEVALAPLLNLEYAREKRVAWRAMVIVDHLLYGVVVAGRLAPEPAAAPWYARGPKRPHGVLTSSRHGRPRRAATTSRKSD
jgi:hypothetical protein